MYYPHAPPPIAVYSDKYRVVAGVLQIVLPFGIGRFYTGHTGIGDGAAAAVFIGVGVIWSLVDGIVMLAAAAPTRKAASCAI